MLHLAMKEVQKEGRSADAALPLGWRQDSLRSGSPVVAGGYISRSTAALATRLTQQPGSPAFAALQLARRALGEAGVARLVQGSEFIVMARARLSLLPTPGG